MLGIVGRGGYKRRILGAFLCVQASTGKSGFDLLESVLTGTFYIGRGVKIQKMGLSNIVGPKKTLGV